MRMIFKSVLLAFLIQLTGAAFAEPTKVAFRVICDDQGTAEMISNSIRTRLDAAGFQITEQFPVKKLLVYAQRDVNSNLNTQGWTFAVAHASNQATFFVAAKVLTVDTPLTTEVKPVLVSMLQEQGFLTYMNVAHVDKLDTDSVSALTANFVGEFRSRVPSEQPVGK